MGETIEARVSQLERLVAILIQDVGDLKKNIPTPVDPPDPLPNPPGGGIAYPHGTEPEYVPTGPDDDIAEP